MNRRMNYCLVLLIGGVVGGCTAIQGGPPVQPAGTEFDGRYGGQNTLIGGWGYMCGDRSHVEELTVSGGQFAYPFAVNPPRTAPVPVQIGADGSLVGQMQYGTDDYLPVTRYKNAWVTVTGRIAGGTLNATVIDDRCMRQLTAQRE